MIKPDWLAIRRRGVGRSRAGQRSGRRVPLRGVHESGQLRQPLTRASTATTGLSAPEVLEAKRLLAYTDLAASAVGRRLGFSEPTNFGKFFLGRTGLTPAAFRRTLTR